MKTLTNVIIVSAILLLSQLGLISCSWQPIDGSTAENELITITPTPAITPVSGHIVAATHLHILASDGSSKISLGLVGQSPRWSPDGTEILFAAIRTQPGTSSHQIRQERGYPESAVIVTDASGTEIRILTDDTVGVTYPDWSPDGQEIVFLSAHLHEGRPSIFLMERDGSNIRLLLDCSDFVGGCYRARWSPQGDVIAFSGDGLLQTIDIHTATQVVVAESGGYSLEWSPSGEKLLFARGNGIFVVQRDGNNLRELFRLDMDTRANLYPTWSPDGEQIMFGATYRDWTERGSSSYDFDPPPSRSEIWLMTSEGTKLTLIDRRSLLYPHWR